MKCDRDANIKNTKTYDDAGFYVKYFNNWLNNIFRQGAILIYASQIYIKMLDNC